MAKRGVIIAVLVIFIISQFIVISADGGYFPPPGKYVSPGEQKAVIYYKDGIETLIVASEFTGNAEDLAWIIPTPTKPDVTKADEVIFTKLAALTEPQSDESFGFFPFGLIKEGASDREVYIFESKQVGYYDVNILYASNSQDLVDWFNENNYQYPEAESYVLQHYIDMGWFFTAIKVSTSSLESSSVQQDIKQGTPEPVKMIFRSDDGIVFPLRISSIEFKNNQSDSYNYYRYGNYPSIHVFLIGDGKYETPYNNFFVNYANWFEYNLIEEAIKDDEGNPLINLENKEYFVTRFFALMPRSEMNSDVYFNLADNNEKVGTGPEPYEIVLETALITGIILLVFLLSPFGWIFIIGTLILFLSKNETARIFGWVMEILILVLAGLFFFGVMALGLLEGEFIAVLPLIISAFLVIAAIITIILIQKKKSKKK